MLAETPARGTNGRTRTAQGDEFDTAVTSKTFRNIHPPKHVAGNCRTRKGVSHLLALHPPGILHAPNRRNSWTALQYQDAWLEPLAQIMTFGLERLQRKGIAIADRCDLCRSVNREVNKIVCKRTENTFLVPCFHQDITKVAVGVDEHWNFLAEPIGPIPVGQDMHGCGFGAA